MRTGEFTLATEAWCEVCFSFTHGVCAKTDYRYPTSYPEGPVALASRLKSAKGWKAKGDLSFLNNWSYQLGAEILTPFGRSQLCEYYNAVPKYVRRGPG